MKIVKIHPIVTLIFLSALITGSASAATYYAKQHNKPAQITQHSPYEFKPGIKNENSYRQPVEAAPTNASASDQSSTNTPATTRSPGTSKSSTYTPGVCTETPIPYKTEYQDSALLNKGETKHFLSGVNGYTKTCTADSNGVVYPPYTSPPTNEVVWVGTKEVTAPTQPAAQPKNYSQCYQFADSSAYQACINAVNRQ